MGKTPLREVGFSKAQQRAPGILIPLHGVDGTIICHQYRPDKPREDTKRGRPIKYENPLGSSVRLDVPPRCRKQLGDPSVPLPFTEGAKKADSLATQGACAINLGSVWGFKGKNPFGGVTLQSDFDSLALKGRDSYVIYDSDYATNPFVHKAQERLLTTRGWCMWKCSTLGGDIIAVVRDENVEGVPEGYPAYTEAELEELCQDDVSEATLRLVNEGKKLARAKVTTEATN